MTNKTMGARELTGCDDWNDAAVAIYTDSEMMAAWLAQPASLRDKVLRAFHCRGIALAPQGRFGLESCPADVVAICDAFIRAAASRVAPLAAEIAKLRAEGLASDEIWSRVDGSLGFAWGDSELVKKIATWA